MNRLRLHASRFPARYNTIRHLLCRLQFGSNC